MVSVQSSPVNEQQNGAERGSEEKLSPNGPRIATDTMQTEESRTSKPSRLFDDEQIALLDGERAASENGFTITEDARPPDQVEGFGAELELRTVDEGARAVVEVAEFGTALEIDTKPVQSEALGIEPGEVSATLKEQTATEMESTIPSRQGNEIIGPVTTLDSDTTECSRSSILLPLESASRVHGAEIRQSPVRTMNQDRDLQEGLNESSCTPQGDKASPKSKLLFQRDSVMPASPPSIQRIPPMDSACEPELVPLPDLLEAPLMRIRRSGSSKGRAAEKCPSPLPHDNYSRALGPAIDPTVDPKETENESKSQQALTTTHERMEVSSGSRSLVTVNLESKQAEVQIGENLGADGQSRFLDVIFIFFSAMIFARICFELLYLTLVFLINYYLNVFSLSRF
jgi:hypothetical protein